MLPTHPLSGLLYAFICHRMYIAAIIETMLAILAYVLVTIYIGVLDVSATATGVGEHVNPGTLFTIGLLGGLLSFGECNMSLAIIQLCLFCHCHLYHTTVFGEELYVQEHYQLIAAVDSIKVLLSFHLLAL